MGKSNLDQKIIAAIAGAALFFGSAALYFSSGKPISPHKPVVNSQVWNYNNGMLYTRGSNGSQRVEVYPSDGVGVNGISYSEFPEIVYEDSNGDGLVDVISDFGQIVGSNIFLDNPTNLLRDAHIGFGGHFANPRHVDTTRGIDYSGNKKEFDRADRLLESLSRKQ